MIAVPVGVQGVRLSVVLVGGRLRTLPVLLVYSHNFFGLMSFFCSDPLPSFQTGHFFLNC